MRRLRSKFNRGLLTELLIYVVIIGFFWVVRPVYRVEGHSMDTTLAENQYLVVSGINYTPNYNDIVIFRAPNTSQDDPPLVKRVIGIPGDTVTFRDQTLYVNGVMIDEPYILEDCSVYSCRDREWHLGTDEYFVMGDNRNHSYDSRFFGPIHRDAIIGQALLRLWPPWEISIFAD